jgi:hypothetical protein
LRTSVDRPTGSAEICPKQWHSGHSELDERQHGCEGRGEHGRYPKAAHGLLGARPVDELRHPGQHEDQRQDQAYHQQNDFHKLLLDWDLL